MTTSRQTQAARTNVRKAQKAAASKRVSSSARKPSGSSSPKTRAELYAMARKRGIAGRSTMRRDELARSLGQR